MVQFLSCLIVKINFLQLLKWLLGIGYKDITLLPVMISMGISSLRHSKVFLFSYFCSLFHVVVETDDISATIIRILTAEKGGRVTFIPLNRVKAPHVTYPQSSDVVPLLKKLKFSSRFSPAFAQVWFFYHLNKIWSIWCLFFELLFILYACTHAYSWKCISEFVFVIYFTPFL